MPISDRPSSKEINIYLREATRSYVWGFWQGSIAFSRAAVEAAIKDHEKLLADIDLCRIACRNDSGFVYPDLRKRVKALRLNWACYEDLLEQEFGDQLDIVTERELRLGIKSGMMNALDCVLSPLQ
jgi:hypothetical protein